MDNSGAQSVAHYRPDNALRDVVESLTSEQLDLVALWLDKESQQLERSWSIPNVLPDISQLLRLCAKTKARTSRERSQE